MPSVLKEKNLIPEIATAEVTLSNGAVVTVKAVSGRQWAKLFERFPGLGRADGVDPESSLIVNMKSTPAVIAAGVGNPDDPEEEEAADRLPFNDQWALVREINRLSFPDSSTAGADQTTASGDQQGGQPPVVG